MAVPRERVGISVVARQRSNPVARQRARLGHESNRVHARSSVDTRNRCRGTRIATSVSGPGRSILGCYGGGTRPNSRDCRPSPVGSRNHSHIGKPLSAWNAERPMWPPRIGRSTGGCAFDPHRTSQFSCKPHNPLLRKGCRALLNQPKKYCAGPLQGV